MGLAICEYLVYEHKEKGVGSSDSQFIHIYSGLRVASLLRKMCEWEWCKAKRLSLLVAI